MFKPMLLVVSVLVLSGCEVLQQKLQHKAPVLTSTGSYLCESESSVELFEEFCNVQAWSDFLIETDALTWTARNALIKSLSNAPKFKLQQILLSQGSDTPYANRLRAQNWITSLQPQMDEKMQQVLKLMVFEPSQQILELESAITILTRLNTRQEKTIEELEQTLSIRSKEMEKQRDQVEQLLKIEASMSKQKRSN
jgi:uncharacterized coiled-coil protein SlyX